MKNKTIICLLLLIVFAFSQLRAQKLVVELATGLSSSKIKYKWGDSENESKSIDKLKFDYSIGISAKMYKRFYIKAQAGNNDIYQLIDFKYQKEGEGIKNLSGWLELNQSYIDFLPEIRTKWLFVNMGIGLSRMKNSRLRFATYVADNQLLEAPGFKNRSNLSFSINVGGNIRLKNFGLLLAFGFKETKVHKPKWGLPGIGLEQVNARLGICYHFLCKE